MQPLCHIGETIQRLHFLWMNFRIKNAPQIKKRRIKNEENEKNRNRTVHRIGSNLFNRFRICPFRYFWWQAIAEGASRLNDITMKVGEDNSVVSKYLKTLIDLGIVKKETPISEKPGKKTIYLLADNFFRFWYRFVPVNMSAIDSDRIAKTYPHAVKQYLPDYMGLIFEKMCQDYLLYYADKLPIELNEIGQWWGTDSKKKKQIQIGIVGTPVEGKEYIIGSCKYRNEKIGVDELELIRDYASVFGKGNTYHYYIFSKGGFTDGLLQARERGEVQLITLEDLYK